MKAFLDTSSLIKLYHQEEGSDSVTKAMLWHNQTFSLNSSQFKGHLT